METHNATTAESNLYSGMKMSWMVVAHTHMDMQIEGGREKGAGYEARKGSYERLLESARDLNGSTCPKLFLLSVSSEN